MTSSPDLDVWGRRVYSPAPRHVCPPHHPHGSTRCLDKDGCACETCEEARDARTLERRRRDLETRPERPVTIRFVKPTKSAQARPQKRPERLQTYVEDREPKALPEGLEHGNTGYSSYRCRCTICKSAHAGYQKAYRLAKRNGTAMPSQSRTHEAPISLSPSETHGSWAGYDKNKCRCVECCAWAAEKRKRHRAKNRT